MTGIEHERFHDDAGAFLLGALGDDERQAFELHMESCPQCRHEVERLRPAAEALPRTVEQVAPPERLRASLMAVVESEAHEAEAAQPRRPGRRRLRDLIPTGAGLRPALAGAMVAVALLAGYGVAQLGSGGGDERTLAAKVDATRLPMVSAQLRVEDDGDHAVLTAEGLPDLGGGRVYQAWVQRGDRILPAPTFVANRDGRGAVALPQDLSGASAVLVTRERRGGALVPGESPIMRVDL